MKQAEIDELLEERDELQVQVEGLQKKVEQRGKAATAGEKKGGD